MNEPIKPEAWGELGPAMKALSEMQREFVRHLVTGKPGHGALTRLVTARRASRPRYRSTHTI